ncbi:tethering complex subunit VPS16 [Sporobolomyces salmoneus]|uniref:tethering complex subunit VPS16 n=1 Tax=Sporobolomyces salmoneus TaxID=183962 RepID=UPI0031765336
MVSAPLSSTWDLLGGTATTFYRKVELYSLVESNLASIDLSDYVVVAAKHGGPIAMMRDSSKPVLLSSGDQAHLAHSDRNKINVYSTAGLLLQTIKWDAPTKIIQLGWTAQEQLVILTQDGTYRLYPLTPTSTGLDSSYTQHSLGSEVATDLGGVMQAKINEEGMVVMLGNFQFVEVKGWAKTSSTGDESKSTSTRGSSTGKGKVVPLAQVQLEGVPDCWCVIPSSVSSSRGTEVLIGTGQMILRLDEIEVQDQRVNRGPFRSIVPSPSGRFLALLTSSSELWVTSLDFSRSLSEFSLVNEAPGESSPIRKIEWCGSNSVVVAWERTIVMVGPFGETLKYFYADPVELIGEVDGTRILSSETCDFLQIVPQSSQSIFLPGSTSPASILYEASQLFNQRSPKADEYIRSIRGDLHTAVDGCIDAASREWDVEWQKKLLQAAAFGKSFLEAYNPTEYVQTTKNLRILNALRDYKVGLPLTIDQFNARPLPHLIARLNSRSQHLLALRISSYLGLSPSPVLRHWAQQLIASSAPSSSAAVLNSNALPKTDQEICTQIVDKLSSFSLDPRSPPAAARSSSTSQLSVASSSIITPIELSSADIALTAFNLGRTRLALMLVEKEMRCDKKIGMLNRMGEIERALEEAEKSGDSDLVYSVLLPMLANRASGDVFRLLPPYPLSTSLLQLYGHDSDRKLLRDFYYVDDRRWESALLELEESAELRDEFGERVEKVRKAGKRFAEDKEYAFEAKMTEEHVKLLILQQTLESESPNKRKYVGLSVNDTIRTCISDGLEKRVDKIKKDFSVPDKRFWYVKMKSLVSIRDWDALDTFSRSRKSPIGYEPWVDALIAAGAQRQAVKYIEKCEGRNRVELFVKAGEWVLAGEEAVRRGERGKLLDLKSRAPNSIIAAQLDELIRSMEQAGM